MLLVWWVFLYAFIVFPSQYISLNVAQYDRSFGPFYSVQSAMLVVVLGIAAFGAVGGWRNVYLNLLVACGAYALGAEALDLALSHDRYYTGSIYDVVLVGSMSWMAATAYSARDWPSQAVPPVGKDKWGMRTLRLAMLLILTLPLLGPMGFPLG